MKVEKLYYLNNLKDNQSNLKIFNENVVRGWVVTCVSRSGSTELVREPGVANWPGEESMRWKSRLRSSRFCQHIPNVGPPHNSTNRQNDMWCKSHQEKPNLNLQIIIIWPCKKEESSFTISSYSLYKTISSFSVYICFLSLEK